jgi:hypothetical protein
MNIKDLLDAEDRKPLNLGQEMVILSDREQVKTTKRSTNSKKQTSFVIEEVTARKQKKQKGTAAVNNETERLRKIVKEKA